MTDHTEVQHFAIPRDALMAIPKAVETTFMSSAVRRRIMLVFAQLLAGNVRTFAVYLDKQLAQGHLTGDEIRGFLRLCAQSGLRIEARMAWSPIVGSKHEMPSAEALAKALDELRKPALTSKGEEVRSDRLMVTAGFVLMYGAQGDAVKLDKYWPASARWAAVLAARKAGFKLN